MIIDLLEVNNTILSNHWPVISVVGFLILV